MSNRYAFVATINWHRMFGLNCTMNAVKYFGTNADFYILYGDTPKEYIQAYQGIENVFWIPLASWEGKDRNWNSLYHKFFADKYNYALHIKDKYDAVCIIDGDEFICTNVNEYFRLAAEENKLVASAHIHSGPFPLEKLYELDSEQVIDRGQCTLADLSVFVNPKVYAGFLEDWFTGTFIDEGSEKSHPLISMNRSMRKNIPIEQVHVLNGYSWVSDADYFHKKYYRENDLLFDNKGKINGIHNRWYVEGRGANEFRSFANVKEDDKNTISELDRMQDNFNTVKDYMAYFNEMNNLTCCDYYVKEKLNWRETLNKSESWGK